MRQVREELGPEALILHSRTCRERGPLRLFGRPEVEVLAALDRPHPTRPPTPPPASGSAPVEALRTEIGELRSLLLRLGAGRLGSPGPGRLWERLVASGLDEDLALTLVTELAPGADLEDAAALPRLAESACARAATWAAPATPTASGTLAFVGPPGAGKTATLVKLAAQIQMAGGRVEIVDADASGPGSPAPLESFARILGVPYVQAPTADDVARVSRERWPAPALRLVDTPGVAPRDRAGLEALGAVLRTLGQSEAHLVLPATLKAADALVAAAAFGALGAARLAVTHLDATTTPGSLLTVAARSRLPLSYFGTGREIPGDLEPATARGLAARLPVLEPVP
jgi:flagellar biosynthesis protein FlhF